MINGRNKIIEASEAKLLTNIFIVFIIMKFQSSISVQLFIIYLINKQCIVGAEFGPLFDRKF